MLTRRNFLKLSCGAAVGALTITQSRSFSYAKPLSGTSTADAVILMSAPSVNEGYYHQFFDDLLAFYARFAAATHVNDHPLIVVDRATFPYAAAVIPPQHLVIGNIPDIWMRDFSPVRTQAGNSNMRYLPQYLSGADARYIERRYNRWYRTTGLAQSNLSIILDGGNFNYNGIDSAVITERVLAMQAMMFMP